MAKANSRAITERIAITHSTMIRATPLEVRSAEFGVRNSKSKRNWKSEICSLIVLKSLSNGPSPKSRWPADLSSVFKPISGDGREKGERRLFLLAFPVLECERHS